MSSALETQPKAPREIDAESDVPRELMARLGDLAAVMAHEVKNPVTGISGALHVIKGRLPVASRDRDVIDGIQRRLRRLDKIIDDLLAYARPRPRALSPLALRDLILAAIEEASNEPELEGVPIEHSLRDVQIVADAHGLRQALLHVIHNAAQAIDGAGGTGTISVSMEVEREWVRVAVADTGPGIPEHLRGRVFDPFFTIQHRGTGLGLPLVRAVARAHGGDVEVHCPTRGGTVVTITLARQSLLGRVGGRAE